MCKPCELHKMYSSQAPRADHLRDGEAKSPGDHAGARIIDLARKGTKPVPV